MDLGGFDAFEPCGHYERLGVKIQRRKQLLFPEYFGCAVTLDYRIKSYNDSGDEGWDFAALLTLCHRYLTAVFII